MRVPNLDALVRVPTLAAASRPAMLNCTLCSIRITWTAGSISPGSWDDAALVATNNGLGSGKIRKKCRGSHRKPWFATQKKELKDSY